MLQSDVSILRRYKTSRHRGQIFTGVVSLRVARVLHVNLENQLLAGRQLLSRCAEVVNDLLHRFFGHSKRGLRGQLQPCYHHVSLQRREYVHLDESAGDHGDAADENSHGDSQGKVTNSAQKADGGSKNPILEKVHGPVDVASPSSISAVFESVAQVTGKDEERFNQRDDNDQDEHHR